MSRLIKQLDDDLLLCLSSSSYYLNFIQNDQTLYRIDSQEKIIYFAPISTQWILALGSTKQKTPGKINFIIVFNRRLDWNIFSIEKNKQPLSILHGKLNLFQFDGSGSAESSGFSVVNVHETGNRLIVVLSNLTIHELVINPATKTLLSTTLLKGSEKQSAKSKQIQSQLIFPLKDSPYLALFYLPPIQTSIICDSLIIATPKSKESKQLLSQVQLFLLFQSKNNNKQHNSQQSMLYSLYSLIFDTQQKSFLSGRQCILNITKKVLGIYSLDVNEAKVLVQTEQQIFLWDCTTSLTQNKTQKYQQYSFHYSLTYLNEINGKYSFAGIPNQSSQKNEAKVIKISLGKDNRLTFEEIIKFPFNTVKPLLYFRNQQKFEESYLFYQNYSISKLKSVRNQQKPIFNDHSVSVDLAKLAFIQPSVNLLFVHKITQFSQSSILITNSFVQTDRNQYQHNLPLNGSKLIRQISTPKEFTLFFASPLIGTLPLRITKQNQNNILISLNKDFQSVTTYESLMVSEMAKTFVNPHQIVFSLQANKLGKFPTLSISKIFQTSTDFIEGALLFQKSQTYLLTLDDQIHVFEGNSQKTLKRKFIHCCRGHIKNIFKLNDVNVFGVQLYQNHSQTLESDLSDSTSMTESYSFQIYLMREDKFTMVNKINYGHQFVNFSPISFLSNINTVPYWFNFVYGKVVMVSSEQTHRYNPDKVKVQIYEFPLPLKKKCKFSVIPLMNQSSESKGSLENEFLFLIEDDCCQKRKMFMGSFLRKILVKSLQEIKFSYESIVSSVDLEGERGLFSSCEDEGGSNQTERRRKLMIFTERKCCHLNLSSGKLPFQNLSNQSQKYIRSLLGVTDKSSISDDLHQYKGLEKIEGPLKLCRKQPYYMERQNQSTRNSSQEEVLIYNKFELWYGTKSDTTQTIRPISVYTMVNNDFLQFRNNLSVQQLDERGFIKIFSQKLPIVQVKYLSDRGIIVLFQKQIVVLQIGDNNSLTVRQEIKFSKTNQRHQSQVNEQNNDYSSIQIIELLDRYSETDIFLKDAEGRLYSFSFNPKTQFYQINFDRNLQEDIVCIGRVRQWEQTKTMVNLIHQKQQSLKQRNVYFEHELIVKKDGQLVLKDLSSKKEKSQYI